MTQILPNFIQPQFALKEHNSFGIDARSAFAGICVTLAQVKTGLKFAKEEGLPVLILGGGSNVLFTEDFPGLVLIMDMDEISHSKENGKFGSKTARIRVGAGKNWNELVQLTVEKGWWGIENLSLIPGKAGAAPIQNIGAYGVELSDVLHAVEALDTRTLEPVYLDASECALGYRESRFKRNDAGHFIITAIDLDLNPQPMPRLHYQALAQALEDSGNRNPDQKTIARTVSRIRVSKLPDPSTIGNAGSFFKNPIVELTQWDRLRELYPNMPSFPVQDADTLRYKIPAGWLLEQAGCKGIIQGRVGTWKNQALVLVNHGGATGQEILEFSRWLIKRVEDQFGITLEPEVRIIGPS